MAHEARAHARKAPRFRRPTGLEMDRNEVEFLQGHIDGMYAVFAKFRVTGGNSPRLKSQIREKTNLLKAAIKSVEGTIAYYRIPRGYHAAIPRTEEELMGLVAAAIDDIPSMYERARVPEEIL